MRTGLVIIAVALQVLGLAYLAGEREWIVRTGPSIWLRTAPLDPRDVMRGDYVRLEYEIGRVPRRFWRDGLTNWTRPADGRNPEIQVYASLRPTPEGLAELLGLSDRKPREGLFLRGWLNPTLSWDDALSVRYGVEAFFMEQGKARALEDERNWAKRGVPLNMEVALGANGIGVLKGYRWERLGITLELDTVRTTNQLAGFPQVVNVVRGAKVELKNHSAEPLAVLELPQSQSFALVPDGRWQEPAYRWVGETNLQATPEPQHVSILSPGQSFTRALDLTQPEWFVIDIRTNATDGVAKPLQQLAPDWNSGFRIEYRPPPAEACATLPNANVIWHGRLRSRWFNPMGNVD